jgi:ABC-2 type transport system permease protein
MIAMSIFALLFPISIYFFLFHQEPSKIFTSSADTNNYLQFIVLGFAANAVCINTLYNVGRAMISEVREGTFDSFLLSSGSRLGYFLGTFLEQLDRAFFQFIIIIIFGNFFGAKLNLADLLYLLLSLLIISVTSFSMAIVLSSIMIFTRDTFYVQGTLFTFLSLITGIAFPVSFLPKFWQTISLLIPTTSAIDLMRNLISETRSLDFFLNKLLIIIIEVTIYSIIGLISFKKLEKKLVEEVFS